MCQPTLDGDKRVLIGGERKLSLQENQVTQMRELLFADEQNKSSFG